MPADSATYCGAVDRDGARFLAAVNTDPNSAAVIIAISQQARKRSATRAS